MCKWLSNPSSNQKCGAQEPRIREVIHQSPKRDKNNALTMRLNHVISRSCCHRMPKLGLKQAGSYQLGACSQGWCRTLGLVEAQASREQHHVPMPTKSLSRLDHPAHASICQRVLMFCCQHLVCILGETKEYSVM